MVIGAKREHERQEDAMDLDILVVEPLAMIPYVALEDPIIFLRGA